MWRIPRCARPRRRAVAARSEISLVPSHGEVEFEGSIGSRMKLGIVVIGRNEGERLRRLPGVGEPWRS